ncbi:putative phosphotransacetylase [Lacrimispora xylanisolvens]|uniref:Phosphate propanoyltransferase n=1 Tax=Lacrimispora xylanisolvens TaxID=384636 RepID=A0A2S6HLQ5_9FIRM|nr:phosphate propanoyltransferase [Hungatella xylanolytica]MBE5989813.1 phosphate propanoyltransferase [Paenibacillaceae bacterium]PPK78435.1 putative phosphotransacetylase [Hungatella xylanolytica]
MDNREELIQKITELVLEHWNRLSTDPYQVPVGISARHVHLSRDHVETLFGAGYQLTPEKSLSQPGQFACKEQVEVCGPKGSIKKVRILGPERKQSQVEMAFSDCRILGIKPPVRTSGDLKETPGILLKGPVGEVSLKDGVIIADRHIHMTPEEASWFGVSDGDRVNVLVSGEKAGVLGRVLVRVTSESRLDLHVDTDDANAFLLRQGQWVTIRKDDAR